MERTAWRRRKLFWTALWQVVEKLGATNWPECFSSSSKELLHCKADSGETLKKGEKKIIIIFIFLDTRSAFMFLMWQIKVDSHKNDRKKCTWNYEENRKLWLFMNNPVRQKNLWIFASLARCHICLFVGADIFMRARLGEEKAQAALPLLVLLPADGEIKQNVRFQHLITERLLPTHFRSGSHCPTLNYATHLSGKSLTSRCILLKKIPTMEGCLPGT